MLRVQLKASGHLCAGFIAVHMAAAGTVAPVVFPPWVKAILLAAIGVSLVLAVRRYAFLSSAHAITAIELEDDGAVVCRRDGRRERARLLGSTYISPYLTLLNLRITGRLPAQHVIVVPDNVEEEAFRRLRVWLRWGFRES